MKNRFSHSHLARKRFGQNFLKDPLIINNIIASINPKKKQAMVEIGPGFAALTKPISKYLDHLTVIEIDRNIVSYLKNCHFLDINKLTIYQQDVLTVNFNKISEEMGQSLRIFGNIPYNISTPLIFHLFQYINVITDMFFMLQKDLVNRLIAQPNSKEYSRLSVMAQYFCEIISVLEVPRSAFMPIPNVDSAVIQLVPHTIFPYIVKDIHILHFITKKAFNHRRKMIRNSLGQLFTIDELNTMGIDPTMRAENISLAQYCKIANYFNYHIKKRKF